jgi:hypothetical protein
VLNKTCVQSLHRYLIFISYLTPALGLRSFISTSIPNKSSLLYFLLAIASMGNGQSAQLRGCLDAVCAGRDGCVAYPDTPFYQIAWVKPYNLHLPVEPAAVLRPDTAEDIATAVVCAADNGVHVQAKSGGHSE